MHTTYQYAQNESFHWMCGNQIDKRKFPLINLLLIFNLIHYLHLN